ncbi:MAG: glycosyltransferase family 4 protein [Rhodospirillales bacterium]|jgi:colanic acid biosynthesis glycosyl transferase WcaI|nr:glycosyltransferase family 4 protein [Rhodospirillales bacterium]
MKILFLTENFPPETNAAATRVYERACYWAQWGHEVTVITCAPNFPGGRLFAGYKNRWRQTEEMSGIKVVRVKTYIAANRGIVLRTLDFLSFMVTGFLAGIGQPRADVVAATSPQFFSAVAGWAVGAVRRVPFVFELGDLWPASIAAVGAMGRSPALKAVEALELFLYRRSAAVAALTRSFKDDLTRRGIPGDKIAVVINGVDLPRYSPQPRDETLAAEWGLAGKLVVGYVGTHGMAHALGNVLNAAERIRDVADVRFVLVGGGAERDFLMADAKRRNLDNVIFIPPQPKERMPALWSLCDVALVHLKDSPVFAGVIPSKIFEAMGMGLPVLLAGPEGEASRIVTAREAGCHVAAEDPDALAEAVRNLAENSDLRKSLAEKSLAAAPLYSRERQAREMIEVLELAASGKGGEAGRRIEGVG